MIINCDLRTDNALNIKNKNERSDASLHWHDCSFAISIICFTLGAIIRIAYCIQYPVQPRDAYTYCQIITQWEETGELPNTVYYPLSLWLLKIPLHLFHYDCMKGGIMINLLLGLFLIVIVVNTIKHFFKNDLIILFAGLCIATHPTLVSFSCSFLRENSYLFFSLLALTCLVYYYRRAQYSYLFFAGIFGAFSFLCRAEGIELLPIIYITLFFLCLFKKVRLSKAFWHGLVFSAIFIVTVLSIYCCFGYKTFSPDIIMSKLIWSL